MKKRLLVISLTILWTGLVVIAGINHQALLDWFKLRGYKAPASVSRLASEDDMTPLAQHLFYVNQPSVATGSAFTGHCPTGSEKTVVLGCYLDFDSGIYIYHVTDSRLNGVEQVTAAHEMLHAAYRRLSSSERSHIDAMLQSYYAHDLTDQRIKDTIEAYKQSEPHDVVNEMHSVFGTEVASLPAPLEQYFKRYFTHRSVVVAYANKYEGEFIGREAQIQADDTQLKAYATQAKAYNAQLKSLKQQIDANNALLDHQGAALDAQNAQLQAARNNGQVSTYNAGIPAYNQSISAYDALLATTRDQINQYNSLVGQLNTVIDSYSALLASQKAILLEEQQLNKALTASPDPIK